MRPTCEAAAPIKAEAQARCPLALEATSGALQPAAALARGEMGRPADGVLAGEARRHGEEEGRPGRCLCSRRRGATLAGARVSERRAGRAGGRPAAARCDRVRSADRPSGDRENEAWKLGSGPNRRWALVLRHHCGGCVSLVLVGRATRVKEE